MSIEKRLEKIEEDVYNMFETLCCEGNSEQIESFIVQYNIDCSSQARLVNYDEGLFLQIIAKRNDLELLKLLIKYGADIHICDDFVLSLVALKGYIDLLEYLLLDCKMDYKSIMKTNAYNNHYKTKQYMDDYIKSNNLV